MIGRVETMWEDWMYLCHQTNMTDCEGVAAKFADKKMASTSLDFSSHWFYCT